MSSSFNTAMGVNGLWDLVWFEELQRTTGLHINLNARQNAVLQGLFCKSSFYYSTAILIRHKTTGEAVVERAGMSTASMIDAVVTANSDAFIFGAITVIKIWKLREDKGMIKIFDAASIHEKVDQHFTRDGFILYALLAGGDYNKGLQGWLNMDWVQCSSRLYQHLIAAQLWQPGTQSCVMFSELTPNNTLAAYALPSPIILVTLSSHKKSLRHRPNPFPRSMMSR
ncbi:hypothetical protein FIBSPDRAFT_884659 [Athelia psychrophila]|uniref:XPG-I domain-containing protein n=1 Tax=Athelia psychrophila TaxID=1759441 RepID=A0A166SZI1_9AGAM|nr:hypothetical protein FIBSPDRAFT_884659 [Fibularhizoctonia sp. CBS 109695]